MEELPVNTPFPIKEAMMYTTEAGRNIELLQPSIDALVLRVFRLYLHVRNELQPNASYAFRPYRVDGDALIRIQAEQMHAVASDREEVRKLELVTGVDDEEDIFVAAAALYRNRKVRGGIYDEAVQKAQFDPFLLEVTKRTGKFN